MSIPRMPYLTRVIRHGRYQQIKAGTWEVKRG